MDALEHPAVVTVPRLLSVLSAAAVLGCSSKTVRRRIADGSLGAVVGPSGRMMIRGDDLAAYVAALQRVAHAPRRARRTASSARTYDYLRG